MRYNKYKNHKTIYNGIEFDSCKERDYYLQLLLLQRAGVVDKIDRQVKYILQAPFVYQGHKERAITYYADFKVYYTDGRIEVVDVKGYRTDVYKLKRKLLLKQLIDTGEIFVEV